MRQIKFRGKKQGHNNYIYGTPCFTYPSCVEEFNNYDGMVYYDENGKRKIEYIHIDTLAQNTGMRDVNNNEIFDGDILSDFTETDEGLKKSHRQVFWSEKDACWMLDDSYYSDKSSSLMLSFELGEFEYEISGNIHEHPELLRQ